MSRTLKLDIKETAEELKTLLKKENSAQVKEKIHALYLLKSQGERILNAIDKRV